MKQTFYIKLVCSNFPKGCFGSRKYIFLAVQKGKENVMDSAPTTEAVTFLIPVDVKPNKQGDPNFLGKFVHGKTGDRFLYLVWYNKIGRLIDRFRRAKINLQHLTWKDIESSISQQLPIIAKINLTDKKGHPVCATLKSENIKWQ